jgi:hypothetical protein
MAKKKDLFRKLNEGALKQDKTIIRTEQIKQNLTVLPELKALIPPLRDEEREALEQNLLANGCRDSLLVWEKDTEYILIDGHNRYEFCQRHGLNFNIKLLDFGNMEAVRDYMIDNQLSRRNLTPEQASYLRGLKYEREKQEKGRYDRAAHKGQNDPYASRPTSERLAEELNVSEKTIKRDARYAAGLEVIGRVNPEFKKAILGGSVKVSKSDVQAAARMKRIPKNVTLSTAEDLRRLVAKVTPTTPKPIAKSDDPLEAVKQRLLRLTKKLGTAGADNRKVYDDLFREMEQLKKLIN